MSGACTACGNTLAADGNCSVCLLQLGMSQSDDWNRQPQLHDLPSIEQLNAQFPQLKISRLIGRGGMGAIYHARQTALDRDVALKLVAREVADKPAFVERFEREAKTLAKLSHPNIVTIFDYGRTSDGMAYLIMEFVDGINLREALNAKSVGHEDALEVVSTICKALAYAHSKGIIHRDIKPENILLGEDGTLKVADFGLAKLIDTSASSRNLTATRQVLGSLHYLAPEQLESPEQVDHRVDLYALGVVFYELLTGQLPLGRYEPPSAFDQQIDKRIDAIVMKTLNRKPVQRYQQATDIDSDILQLRADDSRPPEANGAPARLAPIRASVPFTCEAMGGFAEVVGVLYASPDQLRAEFRTRDAVFGQLTSKTQVLIIPTSKLTTVEVRAGIFSSTFVLMADTISTLDSFPNAETGRVELIIKRSDHNQAVAVINALGVSTDSTARPVIRAAPVRAETPVEQSRWTTFCIMLLLFGIVNAGFLAIVQVVISHELRGIELAATAIGATVVLTPIFLIQIITGCVCLAGRTKSLAIATSIVSLLPVTPVWILSFPLGVCALRWLREPATDANGARGWGTTTMMLLRESRWSRIFAMANVGALLVASLGFAIYTTGYYPTTLEYRVVGSGVDGHQLQNLLRVRLANISKVEVSESPTAVGRAASRVKLRTLMKNRLSVIQQLSFERNVQLVWLAAASSDSAGAESLPKSQTMWSVAQGLELPAVSQQQKPLGTQVLALGDAITLRSELVSRLRPGGQQYSDTHFGDGVLVELSLKGRELLEQSAPPTSQVAGLGLVVDGIIRGFAAQEHLASNETPYMLAQEGGLSASAIIAAIRGPELPTELELLD